MAATDTAATTATDTATETATTTETETSSQSLLEFLFKYGSELSDLLHEVNFSKGSIRRTLSSRNKQTKIPFPEDFHERVKALVKDFLIDLKVAQGSISEDSVAKMMGIIEGLLPKLVHIDKANAKTYEELAVDVENFQSTTQHHPSSVLDLKESSSNADDDDDNDNDFEIKYNNLSDDDRRCLFYVTLFPAGTVMNKTELLCLWIGMARLEWHSDGGVVAGEKVLSTLVSQGFIQRLTRHNKLSNRYRMRAGVHTKMIQKAKADPSVSMKQLQTKDGGSFIVYYIGAEINNPSKPVKALLNNGTHTLNDITLKLISDPWSSIVLLHLGSCRGYHENNEDDADYVVDQGIDFLNKLLNVMERLRYLSLRGISGIVELPSSISALRDLRVLDLRACNNLESLSNRIHSLNQLLYLDLSECYLLAHIPKNIASLSKLRVLKGFIINPDSYYSSCDFSHLSKMKQLNKLTIRTRRMDFPTAQDLSTLSQMDRLHTLGIAWVGQPVRVPPLAAGNSVKLPDELHKLELQAVPESIASQLLGLISKQEDSRLEKLYIRGALFGKLDLNTYPLPHVKHLRLRYLPHLDMKWSQFQTIFSSLTRLEIFECLKLNDIPLDEYGVWEGNVGASSS